MGKQGVESEPATSERFVRHPRPSGQAKGCSQQRGTAGRGAGPHVAGTRRRVERAHSVGVAARLRRCVSFLGPFGRQPGRDADVVLYDTRGLAVVHRLFGHQRTVTAVSFSPDGRRLVSASNDNTLKLWDVAIGREVATLHGHEFRATCVAFLDAETIVSGGHDNQIGSGRRSRLRCTQNATAP